MLIFSYEQKGVQQRMFGNHWSIPKFESISLQVTNVMHSYDRKLYIVHPRIVALINRWFTCCHLHTFRELKIPTQQGLGWLTQPSNGLRGTMDQLMLHCSSTSYSQDVNKTKINQLYQTFVKHLYMFLIVFLLHFPIFSIISKYGHI